jgi:hypothetical protein
MRIDLPELSLEIRGLYILGIIIECGGPTTKTPSRGPRSASSDETVIFVYWSRGTCGTTQGLLSSNRKVLKLRKKLKKDGRRSIDAGICQ